MANNHDVELQRLWAKYEEVAMHFNDLLIKLRTQSLAGVAAVSALVGIFSKEGGPNLHVDWIVAEAIFGALIAFWLAIWCLDLLYYNRLLSGAVKAIVDLEKQTGAELSFNGKIELSTKIEDEFAHPIWSIKEARFGGIVSFYVIVFVVLVGGFVFAHNHAAQSVRVQPLKPCTISGCPS